MNSILNQTAHLKPTDVTEWQQLVPFISDVLGSVACCLRLTRTVAPFLKDTKKYFTHILKIFKQFAQNKPITVRCLQLIKLFMHNEECTQLVLSQFSSLSILLLQIIDYNQKNFDIVQCAIYIFKCIAAEGKPTTSQHSKKIIADILSKPQLSTLKSLMDQIMQQKKITSADGLLEELNKDIFSPEI